VTNVINYLKKYNKNFFNLELYRVPDTLSSIQSSYLISLFSLILQYSLLDDVVINHNNKENDTVESMYSCLD
jgi:hypothetical protein